MKRHRKLARSIAGVAAGLLTIALVGGTLLGCCCTRAPASIVGSDTRTASLDTTKTVPASVVSDTTTLIEMSNVHFRIDEALALEVHRLSGEMIPQGRSYVYFDDPEGYVIRIRSAEVGLRPEDLRVLLSRYVFDYPDAPLTISRIAIEDSLLVQEGVLHKVVDIPFEMKASVSVTPEGLIRLHPESMRICDLPGKGLMEALDVHLSDLMDLSGAEGVRVEENDLLLDPQRVLPPPAIAGRLVALRLTQDELVQTLAPEPGDPPIRPAPSPPLPETNYMFFQGGTLRFGDLVLLGSELQIADADPSDPFDFYQDRYRPQFLAGYSEATQSLGQITHMPDYADVGEEVEPADMVAPGEERSVPSR
jgi:hypothetical protein